MVQSTLDLITNTTAAGNRPVVSPTGADVVLSDPTNHQLYVAGGDGAASSGFLASLNVTTGRWNGIWAAPRTPTALEIDSRTGNLFLLAQQGGVMLFNTTSHTFTGPTRVGYNPWGLAFDHANGLVYVSVQNQSATIWNNVTLLNGSTGLRVGAIRVGGYPAGMAYDPVNGCIYVADANSNRLAVINGSSESVVTYILVGNAPSAIAYASRSGDLYVTNSGDSTVSIVNPRTNTLVSTLTPSAGPSSLGAIVYDAQNGWVYADSGPLVGPDLVVINTTTNQIQGYVSFPSVGSGPTVDPTTRAVWSVLDSGAVSGFSTASGTQGPTFQWPTNPVAVAYNPVNREFYVAESATSSVLVFNGSTNALVRVVPIPCSPTGLAVDSRNDTVLVIEACSDLGIINARTNSFVTQIGVDPSSVAPTAAVYDPKGDRFLVASSDNYQTGTPASSEVVVVNATSYRIVGQIVLPDSGARGLDFDRSNGDAYVAMYESSTVDVVNLPTMKLVASIPVGNFPLSARYDPLNGRVYVPNSQSGSVSVISDRGNRVIETLAVGGQPFFATYFGTDSDVYVANYAGWVSVILGKNDQIVQTIPVPGDPTSIAVSSSNGRTYVTDDYSGAITALSVVYGSWSITSFTASPNPVAHGNSTTVTVTLAGTPAWAAYSYSGLPAGCASSNSSTLPCRPTTAGSYFVVVTVVGPSGFHATASLGLRVV